MRVSVERLYRAADEASRLLSKWDGLPYLPITDRESAQVAARTAVEREENIYNKRTPLGFCTHESIRDLIVLAGKVRRGQKTANVNTTKLDVSPRLVRVRQLLRPPTRQERLDAVDTAIRIQLETSRAYFDASNADRQLEEALAAAPEADLDALAWQAVMVESSRQNELEKKRQAERSEKPELYRQGPALGHESLYQEP